MSNGDSSIKISIHLGPKLDISISNPSNVKQLFDNMRNDLSLVISYMDLAIKESAKKNMQLASQKEKITNLSNLAKKYNKESIHLDYRLSEYQNTISVIEHDVLKFKNVLDGVMAITSDLPLSDTDKIKNILEDSFMKKTHDLKRAITELKLFKKNMDAKNDKVVGLQNSLSKMEAIFVEQTASTNLFCSNVEKNTLHIAQTYFDVMSKANDILQMTVGIKQNNDDSLNIMSNYDYYDKERVLQTSVLPKQMQPT